MEASAAVSPAVTLAWSSLDGNMLRTDAENRSKGLPHPGDIWGELRLLRDDRDVGIADAPRLEFRQGKRLFQQGFTGCPKVLASDSSLLLYYHM